MDWNDTDEDEKLNRDLKTVMVILIALASSILTLAVCGALLM